ncbi:MULTISPECIES: hypothetical protein [unclassified Microbacterium]|uniref:hypothetical protein n=1 Tax=unclassified Microbacterium TaxID=2609290 RepID=UPI0024687389|nr:MULTISPECIES: hypothetical protein [unclassified Microbacterium]MDH5134058.1 hypothetical protein [Microbacterium sp. RD10]MDH5136838.1 hypothetical protein [Microbacterium sp. RD11]MDH5146381.1 hypothetical protein [Microbacterium sp. RD12]MDH5156575.1 hypothetical protein [Microbacterium sp. RD06]MDH5168160.1 hypothetical protein [Microbacterium sp. RD02]
MNDEVRLLEGAAELLESLTPIEITTLEGISFSVTTNQSPLLRVAPFLAREMRDTAREYSEPETTVLCEHCWANVSMAKAIIGHD